MVEMVVLRAKILDLRLRHQVLSISNAIQDHLDQSKVTIKNAVERMHKEVLAWMLIPHLWRILIPHPRRILPMRAVI
jgi:hypothetical protein